MNVAYLTTKAYPGGTADHVYVRELARSLSKVCDFALVIQSLGAGGAAELQGISLVNRGVARRHFRALGSFLWLPRFLFGYRDLDIAITNDQWLCVGMIFWRAILRKKFRIVFDWHGLSGTWRDAVICRRTDAAFAVTHGIEAMLQEKGFKKPMIVTPSAVDLAILDIPISKDEARARLKLPKQVFILLYTGRFKTLGNDKGISDTLKALTKLKMSDVLFLAVGGEAAHIAEYAAEARALGTEERVRFVGTSSQQELALYQKAADALIMYFPDLPHYRTNMSPMKMFEYMASGRPIITSDLPTVREVLDESAAFFIPPGRPDILAEAIRKIVGDRATSETKARESYKRVQYYTWDNKAVRMVSFLKTLAHQENDV
jgi:glycosyltransferase involved in cell wall biosynthesis